MHCKACGSKWSHPISGFCLEAKKWTSNLPNTKQPSYPLNGNIWSTAIIMQYIIPREYHLDLHCMIKQSTITVKIQIFWCVTLCCCVCGLWCFEDLLYLQNISNHSPSDSVSHPRRLESSAAAAAFWDLHILQVELQLWRSMVNVTLWSG
jgi:hypothetical protein